MKLKTTESDNLEIKQLLKVKETTIKELEQSIKEKHVKKCELDAMVEKLENDKNEMKEIIIVKDNKLEKITENCERLKKSVETVELEKKQIRDLLTVKENLEHLEQNDHENKTIIDALEKVKSENAKELKAMEERFIVSHLKNKELSSELSKLKAEISEIEEAPKKVWGNVD